MIPSSPEVIPCQHPHAQRTLRSKPLALEEQIRRRAYQLYVERGNESGSELDDWLQAEEEEFQRAEEQVVGKS